MKSLEDLTALRDKERARLGFRQETDVVGKPKITVCMGTCGIAAGARDVLAAFVTLANQANMQREVIVGQSDCAGDCDNAPIVRIKDTDGDVTTYINITVEKAKELFEKHIQQGEVIVEYTG